MKYIKHHNHKIQITSKMTSMINQLIHEQSSSSPDVKYTLKVKETYRYYITGELKEKFDTYTNNIMNENILNDYTLWCIVCKFQKQYANLFKSDTFTNDWNIFTDMIFNYRPWQC